MRSPRDNRRLSSTWSASYFVNAMLRVMFAALTSGFITQKFAGSPAASMLVLKAALLCNEVAAVVIGVPVGIPWAIGPGRICPTCAIWVALVQFAPVYWLASLASEGFLPLKFAR